MRSSTAPCKLPASSSWTVSHDRVYDASQAYGCFCEHSAQGSCVCTIKGSHTSLAFPFPLSFLPRSIAFPLPFPLLFAPGSKSSKISRSESESPSCSMRLGGMLDNDWEQRESDAHVQRGCVWRAMSHTNPRLLEQRALVLGTRRPRARCTRRSITSAAVAVSFVQSTQSQRSVVLTPLCVTGPSSDCVLHIFSVNSVSFLLSLVSRTPQMAQFSRHSR